MNFIENTLKAAYATNQYYKNRENFKDQFEICLMKYFGKHGWVNKLNGLVIDPEIKNVNIDIDLLELQKDIQIEYNVSYSIDDLIEFINSSFSDSSCLNSYILNNGDKIDTNVFKITNVPKDLNIIQIAIDLETIRKDVENESCE